MTNKTKLRGLDKLKTAGSNLLESNDKIEQKLKEYSTDANITFSFTLPISMVAFIKELVILNLASDYHYNDSSAVREGIKLLEKASPYIQQRPEEIEIPTKRGRRSTADKEIKKKNTSFYISEADQNFIYNFIYHKQKNGGIFIKEEFFALLIEQLKDKYKL